MRKTMIIPTYWCRRTGELWQEGDAVYDHPTPVDQEGTLERTLLSMKQFHEKDFKLVILICPTTPEVEEEAYGQVLRITRRAQLNAETYLFTAGDLREMTDILHTTGLTDQGAKLLSMFGYTNLKTSGKLTEHLAEIEQTARKMVEQTVARMAQAEGVTEELKATDPLRWTGLMNNLRHSAEELVLSDLIYS